MLGAQKDIAAEFGRVRQVPVTARLKTCGNPCIFMALAGERLDVHEMRWFHHRKFWSPRHLWISWTCSEAKTSTATSEQRNNNNVAAGSQQKGTLQTHVVSRGNSINKRMRSGRLLYFTSSSTCKRNFFLGRLQSWGMHLERS